MRKVYAKTISYFYDFRWAVLFGLIAGILIIGIINLQSVAETQQQIKSTQMDIRHTQRDIQRVLTAQAKSVDDLKADNAHQTQIIQCFAVLFSQQDRATLRIGDFDNCSIVGNESSSIVSPVVTPAPKPAVATATPSASTWPAAQPAQNTPTNSNIVSRLFDRIRGLF